MVGVSDPLWLFLHCLVHWGVLARNSREGGLESRHFPSFLADISSDEYQKGFLQVFLSKG